MEVMTRQQVADRLGVSVATVRRMEGKELHPTIGINGVRLFDPKEVETIALSRPTRGPAPPQKRADQPLLSGSVTGDVAADVFADLDAGHPAATIVVTRRLPPEVVRRLHSDWLSLRELDLNVPRPSDRLSALEERVARLEEAIAPPQLANVFPQGHRRQTSEELYEQICGPRPNSE